MMMKQGVVFFEQLLFMFKAGDFDKARNSVLPHLEVASVNRQDFHHKMPLPAKILHQK